MSRINEAEPPRTQQETEIAVGAISGVEPSQIRGFAVVVDDGSRQAVVVTNLDGVPLVSMLVGVLRILATGGES